ncbi:hypothetical protein [Actinokineospora iranica]|uniref:Excreted virulence factor EspC, type VII ESX diderm n=1 Tax=Actinokineospora iranica TaxID=1271860 RepID=A0A1G6W7K3_9PSEU|nr:hypothetical protein [Actinokineospora iranica]SDD61801.1 hypothetical protein SAMN05216174_11452 [Actinokineospora iranica]
MPDSGGFDVSPAEIEAHAKKVQNTADLLGTAVDAAKGRLGYEDFGLFGAPLGLACNLIMENATESLAEAQAAGGRHSEAVAEWANDHRVTEESITALFKGTS